MKIYEVTFPPLREGILGDIGRGVLSGISGMDIPQSDASLARDAAAAADKLAQKGYGPGGIIPGSDAAKALSWSEQLKNIPKDPATVKYIDGLVQSWTQIQKQEQADIDKKAAQAQAAAAQTKPAPFAGSAAPLPTVKVSGQLLTKGPDGLWHGEDGRSVTDPAQAAALDKAYYTGMRNQKGTVKEANAMRDPNLKQRRQQRNMSTTTAAAPAPAPAQAQDDMLVAFEKFLDQSLFTRDSNYNNITLADVKKNVEGINKALDQKLKEVVASQYNPASVKDYLMTAVAGIKARSAELKAQQGRGKVLDKKPKNEPEDLSPVLNQAGINVNALKAFADDNLKTGPVRSTGNQQVDDFLATTGIRVI